MASRPSTRPSTPILPWKQRNTGQDNTGQDNTRAAADEPNETAERLLPQNVEAEAGVLGSLLIDPEAIGAVTTELRAGDFYREAHRIIYQAALDLYHGGTPGDLITLTDELQRIGKLEDAGGISYVSSLANQVPTSANVAHYAAIVTRTATLRRMIHAAGQIAAIAYNDVDAAVAIDQAQQLLDAIARSDTTALPQGIVSSVELARLELPEPAWIVPELLTEGLTLLAGREKMGKSWLALTLALAIAAGGRALGSIPCGDPREVLYLALEDTERRLKDRQAKLLADEGGVEGLHFALSWPRLDEGGLHQLDRWLTAHPNAGAVFVDVLAEIRPEAKAGASLYTDDRRSVEGLKELAAKHHVAIVLIHHLRKTPSADVLDEISASTGLMGAVDNVYVLKRERARCDAVLHLTGRDIETAQLALRFDETSGAWTYEGAADIYRMSQERAEIAEVLADVGPLKPFELVTELGREKSSGVRRLLRKMLAAGEIIQQADGRYAARAVEPGTPAVTGNSGNRVTGNSSSEDWVTGNRVTVPSRAAVTGNRNGNSPEGYESAHDAASRDGVTALPLLPHNSLLPAEPPTTPPRRTFRPDLPAPCTIPGHEDYWRVEKDGALRCTNCWRPDRREYRRE